MTLLIEERITNHDTYTKIEKVIQLLETVIASEIPSEQVSMLERLSEIFTILKEALDRVDPWLLSQNTLQNMNGHITSILRELTNYNNNKNVQHLNNSNNHLNNIIPFFSQVMVTRTPEDIEGVRKSVISFRMSIGQHLGNVEKQANGTSEALVTNKEKLNDLTDSIENQKGRVDSVITGFQDQFLKGQTERNEKNEMLIEQTKSEVNKFISISGTKLDEQMNRQQEEHNSQINKNEIEFDEQMAHQEKGFIEEFDKIKEMNKEAEKIVGIISMKGLASGYQKIANDEGRKAFWWNMGSIASILSVIVFGVFFILLHEGTMEWTTLISRIVLSGFGLTLFTYCAKQASNYRNEERRNRKIELELASLDPYLKDLEENQQKDVKQSLVNKYFGVELSKSSGQQRTQQLQQQNVVDSLVNNPQLVQLLTDKISNQMSQNQ